MQHSKALYMSVFVHPHLWRAEMRKLGAIAMSLSPLPLPVSFILPLDMQQTNLLYIDSETNYLTLSHTHYPTFGYFVFALFLLFVSYFYLALALSLSGKPESYAEYFSLNRTTAELLLRKPIDRELHSRFDLVIKVRKTGAANRGG